MREDSKCRFPEGTLFHVMAYMLGVPCFNQFQMSGKVAALNLIDILRGVKGTN